jgi:hypothetical protein
MNTHTHQHPNALTLQEQRRPQGNSFSISSLRFSRLCGLSLLGLASVFGALGSSALHAATPPELTVLRQQYEKVMAEKATSPFEANKTALDTKFTAALDNAIVTAQQAGKLDDVLAIQDDKKRLAEKLPIPDDDEKTPAALKTLRTIYREQLAKLEETRTAAIAAVMPAYQTRLQDLEATLTKAGRIDEAKELRGYREGLAQSGAEAPTVATTSRPISPTAPAAPAPPKVKGDDRKAAEWLIKVGGHFEIEERGKKSNPSKPEDLPKGKFMITSIGLDGRDTKEAISADGLSNLAGLQNVHTFITGQLPLTDSDLAFIATLPALERATFSRGTKITDAIVDHLVELKTLWHFAVTDVSTFTGSTLGKFGQSKTITRMEFISTGFDDMGAEAITACQKINSLTLEGCQKFTDAGLNHIAKLRELRNLSLCNAGCTAEGVAAQMLKIEHFDFNKLAGKLPRDTAPIVGPAYPTVTSIRFAQSESLTQEDFQALAHFKSCKSFSPLSIKDTSAWAGLASVTSLEKLFIDRNPFSDAEIDHLLTVASLVDLTLGTVDVTDAGLLKLAAMKKLKRLGLKPCPKVTDAGIAALKKQRPDIQITR